jgi:hypothetical protein
MLAAQLLEEQLCCKIGSSFPASPIKVNQIFFFGKTLIFHIPKRAKNKNEMVHNSKSELK